MITAAEFLFRLVPGYVKSEKTIFGCTLSYRLVERRSLPFALRFRIIAVPASVGYKIHYTRVYAVACVLRERDFKIRKFPPPRLITALVPVDADNSFRRVARASPLLDVLRAFGPVRARAVVYLQTPSCLFPSRNSVILLLRQTVHHIVTRPRNFPMCADVPYTDCWPGKSFRQKRLLVLDRRIDSYRNLSRTYFLLCQ